MDLLEFWLSKQPDAVFYSPPEVIRGLLQWDYSDATNTPRTPAYNPPSVAAAHRTLQDGKPPGAVGVAYLPPCLCSSHCHPARQCLKKAHFFLALLRGQKRERKAHFLLRGAPKTRLQGAPNSQHGSPRRLLSTRRRLSTLDFRLTALPLSTSTPSRLSKLAIRLPLVWTARPRVRLWP